MVRPGRLRDLRGRPEDHVARPGLAPTGHVRRTRFAFFCFAAEPALDVAAFLRGRLEDAGDRLAAISALTGGTHPVTGAELETAVAVPADRWVEEPEGGRRLAEIGVLVSDRAEPRLAALRRRDELLARTGWDPAGVLFHFASRGGRADELAASVGEPPPAFHDRPGPRIALPAPALEGTLEPLLAGRRTARTFDEEAALPLTQLSSILYRVFGARATATIGGGVLALGKSSPSGGALHPLEAYPFLLRVEGLHPGLYHYGTEQHELTLLRELATADARALAERATAGQSWFAGAPALFVLAARFRRSFWKYREHARAYGVILMDAGALGQTLYLVCTELGLGVFMTAAIDAAAIDEALGLDGFREGAIAICGCGIRAPAPRGLEPDFEPYTPRRA